MLLVNVKDEGKATSFSGLQEADHNKFNRIFKYAVFVISDNELRAFSDCTILVPSGKKGFVLFGFVRVQLNSFLLAREKYDITYIIYIIYIIYI